MAKYTSVTISGYNATPPADDGTVSEANKVKWSTGKTKLTDPLKTAIEAVNTNLVSAFDVGPTALTTSTTLGATHYGDFVQSSGASLTHTLTDAATLGAGWHTTLVSTDTNSITLARATGADTINGAVASLTLAGNHSYLIFVNAAANGFRVSQQFNGGRNTALNGARYGNIWSHNATDATNDWDISAGGCMDATNAYWIATAALTKQADVAWAVGTNAGMLDTGSVANSNYYIWAIARSDTGVTDFLASLSSTAPTMPTGYDYKRLIGWFKRLAGVNTLMDVYETEGGGVEVAWRAPTTDINLTDTLTTTRRTDAVKVPLNFSVVAHLSVLGLDASSRWYAKIMCPDETDAAVDSTNANISGEASASLNSTGQSMHIRTNAVGLIAARSSLATMDTYLVKTQGFRWARRN